jgi:hypothetical protein
MTNIVYLPETIAERPSELRERVPFDNCPMALPTSDPAGWKLLRPVEAIGTLIPNATVIARLSIANPVRLRSSHLTSTKHRNFWDSCRLQ